MGSIVPTSNIGTGGATLLPPTPITYLTQWKIVGNSEVHGNEIWSCGEYNATDGKYHILVQPQGGSIADIALTEPLRKNNIAADTIEFPCDIDGKALVTRNTKKIVINPNEIIASEFGAYRLAVISDVLSGDNDTIRTLNNLYGDVSMNNRGASNVAPPRMYIQGSGVLIRGTEVQQQGGDVSTYKQEMIDFYANGGTFDVLYALATPTTELVDAPQIEEAESYSMVISQGGKAVSWSSFETNSE